MDDWYERERLHFAAQDGDFELVETLVKMGYPINAFDEISMTPLHYAVLNEHEDVAAFLMRSGADVNAHEEQKIGNTPLRNAADRISLRMATLLIDGGADPTIPGWMQLTAVHVAEKRARKQSSAEEGKAVFELLLAAKRERRR
jgi:ankyrin repeat protein